MPKTKIMATARIYGRFALLAANGDDFLRPDGRVLPAKARALIAVLLRSAEMRLTRREAQDLLWSDRGEEQAQGSLRHIVLALRKAPLGAQGLFGADRHAIWLDADRITIDARDEDAGWDAALFQDLKLRDAAFSRWLKAERHKEATGVFPPTLLGGQRPALRVEEDAGGAAGTGVARRIAATVAEWSPVDVDGAASGSHAGGPDTAMTMKIRDFSGDPATGSLPAASLAWAHGPMVSFHDAPAPIGGGDARLSLFQLVNSAANRAMDEFRNLDESGRATRGPRNGFDCIRLIFERRGDPDGALLRFLSDRFEQEQRGIYLAWQAFLLTYILGERKGMDALAMIEEARELVIRAIEIEPNNSMVLALASHVQAFLSGEYSLAHDLAERAVRLNPANALACAFLALSNCYLGRVDLAEKQATYARDIAGEGPHSYLIDSIALITSTVSGDLDRAIWLGESVLLRAPDYRPPLRYLYAIHAQREEWRRFRETRTRLLRLEPDFSHELFLDNAYPVRGLRESGFLERLPKTPVLL